jgi:hypothetical protein
MDGVSGRTDNKRRLIQAALSLHLNQPLRLPTMDRYDPSSSSTLAQGDDRVHLGRAPRRYVAGQ